MAGYWNHSRIQVIDLNGKPVVGAKAYFFASGTLDPLATFTEAGLGTEHANPVSADGFGRFPAVYLDEDDDFFKVRVTTPAGTVIFEDDGIPIVGPTGEGGGAEVPVNPDALAKTGDIKVRLDIGTHIGWVRVNGRTIGSASSGATERANSDTQALYIKIWEQFGNTICAVTGGRGASGAADFAANKALALPDLRGTVLGFLDDMGNSARGQLTTTVFSTASQGPTVLGAQNPGTELRDIEQENLPAVSPAIAVSDADYNYSKPLFEDKGVRSDGPPFITVKSFTTYDTASVDLSEDADATIDSLGSGIALITQPRTVLLTAYVKL